MSPAFKNFSDKNYTSSLGNISQCITTFAKKFNLSSQLTFSKPQIFFLFLYKFHQIFSIFLTQTTPFKQSASKPTFESDHWKIYCILLQELNHLFPLCNHNIILKTLNDKIICVLLVLMLYCSCAYATGEIGPGSHYCHMCVYNAYYQKRYKTKSKNCWDLKTNSIFQSQGKATFVPDNPNLIK